MSVQGNGEIARKLYDLVNQRDIDGACNLVAEEMEWLDMPRGLTWYGPDSPTQLVEGWEMDITGVRLMRFPLGFRQFLQGWLSAMPDLKLEISELLEAGDNVVVQLVAKGTHSGSLATPHGPVHGTGRRLEFSVCDVLHFKDGKLVRGRSYYDLARILDQLGLIPARLAA